VSYCSELASGELQDMEFSKSCNFLICCKRGNLCLQDYKTDIFAESTRNSRQKHWKQIMQEIRTSEKSSLIHLKWLDGQC